MRIFNMNSDSGNPVPNQYIIITPEGTEFFQSYDTIVAAIEPGKPTQISSKACDYSQTTTKYLRRFFGWEGMKRTTRKHVAGLALAGTVDIVEPDELVEMFERKRKVDSMA